MTLNVALSIINPVWRDMFAVEREPAAGKTSSFSEEPSPNFFTVMLMLAAGTVKKSTWASMSRASEPAASFRYMGLINPLDS
jgi:hypothetical protein